MYKVRTVWDKVSRLSDCETSTSKCKSYWDSVNCPLLTCKCRHFVSLTLSESKRLNGSNRRSNIVSIIPAELQPFGM